MSSKLFSRWRLSKRGTDLRHCGPHHRAGEPSSANNTPTRPLANRAIGDLMATQILTCGSQEETKSSSGIAVTVSKSSRSWSPGPQSRVGTCLQVVQSSVNDACEDPLCPRWRIREICCVPWLLSAAGERFGFRVSTCDEVILPTNAARSDWRQCLPFY